MDSFKINVIFSEKDLCLIKKILFKFSIDKSINNKSIINKSTNKSINNKLLK